MTDINSSAVDLSAFMPVDTAVYEVLDPSRIKGTGWRVTFCSDAHPKALAFSNNNARETLRRQRAIEQAQVNGKKYKPEDKEPDDVKSNNVDWVVSRVIDWTPVRIPPWYPELLPFSDESAKALLMKPELGWVYTQFVEYLTDDKSFTKASAGS